MCPTPGKAAVCDSPLDLGAADLHLAISNIMHYFKRHWEEARGDAYNNWGTSTWYFETEPDLTVTRQIEIYASGTVLHYHKQHVKDEFGSLSDQPLDAGDFVPFAIERAEFEHTWNSRKPFNNQNGYAAS